VKANKAILEMQEIDEAFFYPAAGDEGLAVGAALQGYYEFCKRDGVKPIREPLTDLYYGPSFSDDYIESCVKQSGLEGFERVANPVDDAAKLILKGKVVAWFQGRVEFGPRALGCRSILADPRDQDVKRTLNSQVKMRDWFMPFAPSILEEEIGSFLQDGCYAPYMILTFDTTDRRKDIQAAVHPQDLTTRPQVVRKDWNTPYWQLIDAFRSKTGVGALLNTSFNLHGYPIVCTPEQALWTFQNSGLDALVLGDYLIVR
jgi:carbamoyltransferase